MSDARDRIAAAIVALVGSRGYRQTSLEEILAAAAVDEAEFSRHFASKEECFVAVWDELTAVHGVLAARAFAAAGPWRERMRAAAWITLDYLQVDADRTRFLVLEVLNAGEIAQAHRDLAIATQVEWIDAGRREPGAVGSPSRATAEHLAGAINEMLIRKARSGEIRHSAAVLRELMYMAVRPYLGEEAAQEELSMRPPQGVPQVVEPAHRSGPFSPRVSPAWARLRQAMIELALEHGLDGVDAAVLCAHAGVEPAAFARDFESVADCALRVYLANIAEFDRAVFGAVEATEGWPARLRVAAYAAARHVRDRPLSTRFDMLAMLTAGDLAQAHRDRYVRRLIDLIDEGRRQPGAPSALGPATAEGVFGSIYQLLARELQGEVNPVRPEELVPQLMYLAVRPYLGDAAARRELTLPPPPSSGDAEPDRLGEDISAHKGQGEPEPALHLAMLAPVKKQEGGEEESAGRLSRLPPGRHGLSREFVSQNQRDRIAAGIIAAVAEHGYQEATISAIAAAAGLSRRTFYTYFASKDECFFDTFGRVVDHLREAATAAAEPYEEWPDRVRARLGAVLEIFAANPDLARFLMIAPPRAGEEIAARYRQAMDEVLVEVTEGMPSELAARQPSRTAEHALVGGAATLVVRKVEAGEGERLPELLPDLLELTLAPYVGRDEAIRLARGSA